MDEADIVIVGMGHGGSQAAIELRKAGYTGSIVMIDRADALPHERPPLTKDYLAGKKPVERLLIRPAEFWSKQNIELRPGLGARAVHPAQRTVSLSDGSELRYDKLVWSAGGNARRLQCRGADLAGVHCIRDLADADTILAQLDGAAKRVVIVGAGYIGLEAAATLKGLGCEVVVLEAAQRVLGRVTCDVVSDFFDQAHRSRGIDLRLGTGIAQIAGDGESVTGVTLVSGETIAADLVIVGIGIEPVSGPLEAAGAEVSAGIVVDDHARTSLDHVYAIGDCARRPTMWAGGGPVRLESVQNAADMAKAVAASICGQALPPEPVPWFWSNQYDLRLQTVGLSSGYDDYVVRGDPSEASFSVVYLKDRAIIALDCVNATRDYVQGRKLVESRAQIVREALADPAVPLKDLLG